MSETLCVSIILPVLNEAVTINPAILALQSIGSAGLAEIIVVDGDPSGSTIKTITVGGVRTAVAEKGRARQMNYGASLASGDILLFLHADTRLPLNAISLIQEALSSSRFVAGAFTLGFDTERVIFKVTETYVALRTRLTKVPFGDQAIFVRRDYFERMGGYRELPIMEDVEFMKRIRKRGDPVCILREKALTSPRRYEQEGIFFCTFRNMTLQLLYAAGVTPERLAAWYRS
jgi:rSAM/selenodomain-associated transferase 2